MEIELIHYFVEVVKSGSFTKAAKILKVPKSTLSKAVSKLELETSTKLLLRSTRRQTLTSAGRVFYETCLGPIQTLDDAQKSLYGQDSIISGTFRITVPEDIEAYLLSAMIAKLCKKHPKLNIEVKATNQMVDLIKDGIDLAIRIGPLKESNLKVRRIGEVELIPVASKGYIKDMPILKTPKDLISHKCIGLSENKLYSSWKFRNKNKIETASPKLRIETNLMTSLLHYTLADAGVSILPKFLCYTELKSGVLVRVLTDWNIKTVPISLVSPLSIKDSARLKIISDEIIAILRESIKGNK